MIRERIAMMLFCVRDILLNGGIRRILFDHVIARALLYFARSNLLFYPTMVLYYALGGGDAAEDGGLSKRGVRLLATTFLFHKIWDLRRGRREKIDSNPARDVSQFAVIVSEVDPFCARYAER